MRCLHKNVTEQCQNGPSNLFIPFRERPQSTWIVADPRPAFSATKRRNHAPTSFDQQVQISQGRVMQQNKKNCSTEFHGGGGLELVKPVREPASIRLKPCPSLKNAAEILPARGSLLALLGKKQTVGEISTLPSETSRCAPFTFSRTGVQHSLQYFGETKERTFF